MFVFTYLVRTLWNSLFKTHLYLIQIFDRLIGVCPSKNGLIIAGYFFLSACFSSFYVHCFPSSLKKTLLETLLCVICLLWRLTCEEYKCFEFVTKELGNPCIVMKLNTLNPFINIYVYVDFLKMLHYLLEIKTVQKPSF